MTIPTNDIVGGIDDATKCPCIGSIFVAGVVANAQTIDAWKEMGVQDSKLIARSKIQKLAGIIKKTAICFSVQQITPRMIDDKAYFNLNDWEMLTVFNILTDLQTVPALTAVYIDNWEVTRERFYQRFNALTQESAHAALAHYSIMLNTEKLNSLTLIPEHRADENYTVVGAASILAKAASDMQYEQYKKEYGDFGSGSPADPKTRFFVWQHRHNPPPIIRTSWNTYTTLAALETIEDDPLFIKMRSKRT